jgi:hypothetical protein
VGAVLAVAVMANADEAVENLDNARPSDQRIEQFLAGDADLLSAFGPNYVLKIISGIELLPNNSSVVFEEDTNGYSHLLTTSDEGLMRARLDLPFGSEMALLCLFVYDNTPSGKASLRFYAVEMGSETGDPYTYLIGTASTVDAATPGYTYLCVNPSPDPVIRGFFDLNNDGDDGYVWYYATFGTNVVTDLIRYGGGFAVYKRTISPAPANATFTDVPVGAFGFQHVEALVASGITAGCGGGNFCPNAPLTRVQMAVFLAKALGLHWPQ